MSAGSIDLDINNYTIGELISFFKLDNNYSADDLDNKEGELISNILKLYNNSSNDNNTSNINNTNSNSNNNSNNNSSDGL